MDNRAEVTLAVSDVERIYRKITKGCPLVDYYVSLTYELNKYISARLADYAAKVRLDEARWWFDYFLGKPQSGKLGVERLTEPRERLSELERSAKP